jgi:hypothetical protein
LVLGIDFDNTTVNYDALMWDIASQWGLIEQGHKRSKKAIRDSIRRLPEGELHWRRVQAVAYGDRMQEAQLMPGVDGFLMTCKRRGVPVRIISHKTEYSNLGESDVNLRTAAMTWLESSGFFGSQGFGLERANVSFHNTREEKIEQIKATAVTHFIDDLEELFREPSFPDDVVRILLAPKGSSGQDSTIHAFASWREIGTYLFGDDAVEASV